MTLAAMLAASATIAGGASLVTTSYPLPPEAPPPDAALPAVLPQVAEGEFEWGASMDVRRHYWELVILVKRGPELPADYLILLPVFEQVVQQFYTNSTLGLPGVYGCEPKTYRVEGFSWSGENYVSVSIVMTAKEKTAVSFA